MATTTNSHQRISKNRLKLLVPGTVIKYRPYRGPDYIFVFGHFDESSDMIYWQEGLIAYDKEITETEIAPVHDDVYEQMEFKKWTSFMRLEFTTENEQFKLFDAINKKKFVENVNASNRIPIDKLNDIARGELIYAKYGSDEYYYPNYGTQTAEDGTVYVCYCLGYVVATYNPNGSFHGYKYYEAPKPYGVQNRLVIYNQCTEIKKAEDTKKEIFWGMHKQKQNFLLPEELRCLKNNTLLITTDSDGNCIICSYAGMSGSNVVSFHTTVKVFNDENGDSSVEINMRETITYDIKTTKFTLANKDQKRIFMNYSKHGVHSLAVVMKKEDTINENVFKASSNITVSTPLKLSIEEINNLPDGTLFYIHNNDGEEYIFPKYELEELVHNKYRWFNCCICFYEYEAGKWNMWYLKNPYEGRRLGDYNSHTVVRLANAEEKEKFWKAYKHSQFSARPYFVKEELQFVPSGQLIVAKDKTDTISLIGEFKSIKDNNVYIGRNVLFSSIDKSINIDLRDKDDNTFGLNEYTFRLATTEEQNDYKEYIENNGSDGLCIRIVNAEDKHFKKEDDFESRLQPFKTKVLVCNGKGDIWRPAIYGCLSKHEYRYVIVGGAEYKHCCIYRENKELLGKTFKNK